jgi:hypothetical protein
MSPPDRHRLHMFCVNNPWTRSVKPRLMAFLNEGHPFDCIGYNSFLAGLKDPPQNEQGTRIRCVPVPSKRAHKRNRKKDILRAEQTHSLLGYQERIYLTGELETRNQNVHDLFNLMVWVSLPKLKAVHNSVSFWSILRGEWAGTTNGNRSALGDGLTLLDESGLIKERPDGQLLIFGHALLEHLFTAHPRVHGYLLTGPSSPTGFADALRKCTRESQHKPGNRWPLKAVSLNWNTADTWPDSEQTKALGTSHPLLSGAFSDTTQDTLDGLQS